MIFYSKMVRKKNPTQPVASWFVHRSIGHLNLYFKRVLWLFRAIVISQIMQTMYCLVHKHKYRTQTAKHTPTAVMKGCRRLTAHCYISPSPLACFTNINTPTPPNTTHFFIYIHPLQHLTTTLHFISTPDVARTTTSSSFHCYCKRARFPTIVQHG